MGTCGKAYFRTYLDHNLPEFLFPYEPDYALLKGIDPGEVSAFWQSTICCRIGSGCCYCGRLVEVK